MQRIGLLVAVGLAGGCGPERSASLSGSVSGFEIPTNPGDAYFRLDQDGLAVTLSERGGSCGSEVAALHDNTRVEVLVRAIGGALKLQVATYPVTMPGTVAAVQIDRFDPACAVRRSAFSFGRGDATVMIDSVADNRIVGRFESTFTSTIPGDAVGQLSGGFNAYVCLLDDPGQTKKLPCR
ncbi:MAG: hypothetical protein U1E65_33485 [Myxococcota bacterium]